MGEPERNLKSFEPLKNGDSHLSVYESSTKSAPYVWVNVNDTAIELSLEQIEQLVKDLKYLQDYHYQLEETAPEGCCCLKCGPPFRKSRFDKTWKNGFASWMAVCPYCGNKRCPGAASHNNPCSGSNEVGQKITKEMEGYATPPWEKAGISEEEFADLPIKVKLELFFRDEEVKFDERS